MRSFGRHKTWVVVSLAKYRGTSKPASSIDAPHKIQMVFCVELSITLLVHLGRTIGWVCGMVVVFNEDPDTPKI